MKKVYVFFADGYEEVEAFTQVDVLKRAGADVVMVSVTPNEIVVGAHDVSVLCDKNIDSCDLMDADLLLLPGGMPGAQALSECEFLGKALQRQVKEGKPVAAICAAPMVLGKLGILQGKHATCYPGFEGFLAGATYTGASVERDGLIITGKGPGVSQQFAFAVVDLLFGADKVAELKAAMMVEA